jgi:hypothetical protein
MAPRPTPTPDRPVTDTIADSISAGDPEPIQTQIGSDGLGPYANSSTLVSIIQGASGDWILDSKNPSSATRKIRLDFSKPIAGTGPNGGNPVAPFASSTVFARLISKCHEYGNDMRTMGTGGTATCPLAIFFASGGNEYMLQMNPGPYGADLAPESDFLSVKCNGLNDSLQCNNWTLTANGACLNADCSVRQNVARLNLRVLTKGKSGSWTTVKQGNFQFAFSIGITNP